MRISRLCVSVATAAGLSLCAAAHAGFTLVDSQASSRASSSLTFGPDTGQSNSAGSDFSAFLSLNAGFDGSVFFDEFNYTNASSAVSASIDEALGTITGSGSVAADVDADDAAEGFASATSSLTIVFSISEPMTWTIDASAVGVHADASILFSIGMTTIYDSFVQDPATSGIIGPGLYTLAAGAGASSDLSFFSGLFADASYSFTLQLAPIPAPGAAALVALAALGAARRRSRA